MKALEALAKIKDELITMCNYVQSKDNNAFVECNHDIKKYVEVNYTNPIEKELKEHEELVDELGVALNLNECQSVKEWAALMQKKLKVLEIILKIPNFMIFIDYNNDRIDKSEYEFVRKYLEEVVL